LPNTGSRTLRFVAVGVFVTVVKETEGSDLAASRRQFVASMGNDMLTIGGQTLILRFSPIPIFIRKASQTPPPIPD